ncbi:MAG: cation transporter [Gammaproteobacteria bacterium]|nr:MAG: cation transporter [Gammaproteobacteria bacterium]
MLIRILIASVVLFSLWLLLSGHFGVLLLSLGVLSCIFVAWVSEKLGLFSSNYSTLKLNFKLPKFLPWFFVEVVKSNLIVSFRILHPKLPIEPNVMTLDASQHGDLATAVYANCITLTPGTYSLDLDSNSIEVHSLTIALAEDLKSGEMSRRISALESKPATDSVN